MAPGFYERSLRILADLDEAESALAQERGALHGQLRVALPLSFGIRHMDVPICDFGRRHPGVEFHLDLNDRRVDLVEEGMDVAIRIGRLHDSTLIARRLFDAHTVVCASPGYLSAQGVPETPEDLRQHRCLSYGNAAEPGRWHYTGQDGKPRSVVVGKGMTASSGEFLCAAAAADQGIVLQPTFIAHEGICSGRLVPVLTRYDWPVTPGYAVYPPTRHLSYRVRAFIDHLVTHFSEQPSWDKDCGKAG